MDKAVIQGLLERALARSITFSEILGALTKEHVESYHVDFLRNECRYYATNGESVVVSMPFAHVGVAQEFSAEKFDAINQRVQAGKAGYPDFVSEGTAAGCAYYIVCINGKMVRYFGRDGGELVQYFPGARP